MYAAASNSACAFSQWATFSVALCQLRMFGSVFVVNGIAFCRSRVERMQNGKENVHTSICDYNVSRRTALKCSWMLNHSMRVRCMYVWHDEPLNSDQSNVAGLDWLLQPNKSIYIYSIHTHSCIGTKLPESSGARRTALNTFDFSCACYSFRCSFPAWSAMVMVVWFGCHLYWHTSIVVASRNCMCGVCCSLYTEHSACCTLCTFKWNR